MFVTINFTRDYAIDKIVHEILSYLGDDTFEAGFKQLTEKLKVKLDKNYCALLLEKIHVNLELFSWLDLLLLEEIFHFNISDDNGKTFRFKEIEMMCLQSADFYITFNKAFGEKLRDEVFCDYLIINLSDFLKKKFSRFLNNSTSVLPSLRSKKSLETDINEDPDIIRLVKENSTCIKPVYDIDGFSFCTHNFEENDIRINMHLEFCRDNINTIYSKRPICEALKVMISDLCHLKIGRINTHIGRVSVFFMVPEVEIDTNLFLNRLYTAAHKNVNNENRIECFIPVNGLVSFFTTLQVDYPGSFFFLESFGNKVYFSSSFFFQIYSSLTTIFSEKLILKMNIDIGLNATSTDGKAFFIKPDAFHFLNIIPNYTLFFCESMGNFHKRYCNLLNGVLAHKYGSIKKINFYSLFEDCFSSVRKLSFFPSMSLNMVKNNLYDFVYKIKN